MTYKSLEHCISELQKKGEVVKIKKEVDPNLEMASIHLNEFREDGKVLFFENIMGTDFRAVSNIFGNLQRSRFIFKDSLDKVQQLIKLRTNPKEAFKNPIKTILTAFYALYAIPKKVSFPSSFIEKKIEDLPQIKCWKDDGGSFITLPQVYSEDPNNPGIMNSNLGMYRIQISGNEYVKNNEIGLHYQIHRGIGVHQKNAMKKGLEPLKVSIFIGGPPAHTFSAVMPLPEGISELSFAGVLAGRRFRYAKKDGYTISTDADFVICGDLYSKDIKPEGPFGDHLGYYSLTHNFPYLRVKKVYAKKNAIFPFTVVGRPPQEDSQFGKLIHEITGKAVEKEIPGLLELNAVDESGVHPLLLAIGSERYTPFKKTKKPQELLTIANHILGTGQLSLAKYVFICDEERAPSVYEKESFFTHFLAIVDWERDMHFYTKTTIDTLDYSSDKLNEGSKVVIAAAGCVKRKLSDNIDFLPLPSNFSNGKLVSKGNLIIQGKGDIEELIVFLQKQNLDGIGLITLVDDSDFVSKDFSNWLWVTFTRSNPASDIYGLNTRIVDKHFSCDLPIIDARTKEHHAPILER